MLSGRARGARSMLLTKVPAWAAGAASTSPARAAAWIDFMRDTSLLFASHLLRFRGGPLRRLAQTLEVRVDATRRARVLQQRHLHLVERLRLALTPRGDVRHHLEPDDEERHRGRPREAEAERRSTAAHSRE